MTAEDTAAEVRRHYGDSYGAERILNALAANGIDIEHLAPEALYPFDQFHARNIEGTRAQLARLGLRWNEAVLDVGCGIGGPARYMAATFGARVTGIDLTPEFVAAARELSQRSGLGERVRFETGDALSMPFPDRSFDAATCLYVAMNIPDKKRLAAEIARVLRPGGKLLWSQAARLGAGSPAFPLPWAREPSASFLPTAAELRDAFRDEDFRIVEWSDESAEILDFGRRARTAPPQGSRLLLGEGFAERGRNFQRGLAEGILCGLVILAERM